jgi:hypothetical protein
LFSILELLMAELLAVSQIKKFRPKHAHSDSLSRFFSVAGTWVPRVQELGTKVETERKKEIWI